MKLYTEADMIRMYNAGYGTAFTGYGDADIALQRFTPIELPSDEEIEENSTNNPYESYECGYVDGVNLVLNKIKQQADGK